MITTTTPARQVMFSGTKHSGRKWAELIEYCTATKKKVLPESKDLLTRDLKFLFTFLNFSVDTRLWSCLFVRGQPKQIGGNSAPKHTYRVN